MSEKALSPDLFEQVTVGVFLMDPPALLRIPVRPSVRFPRVACEEFAR